MTAPATSLPKSHTNVHGERREQDVSVVVDVACTYARLLLANTISFVLRVSLELAPFAVHSALSRTNQPPFFVLWVIDDADTERCDRSVRHTERGGTDENECEGSAPLLLIIIICHRAYFV